MTTPGKVDDDRLLGHPCQVGPHGETDRVLPLDSDDVCPLASRDPRCAASSGFRLPNVHDEVN